MVPKRRFTADFMTYPRNTRPATLQLAPVGALLRAMVTLAVLSCARAGPQLSPIQRGALVDVYISTNGAQWTRNAGWTDHGNSSNDPCVSRWAGVTCLPSSDPNVLSVT